MDEIVIVQDEEPPPPVARSVTIERVETADGTKTTSVDLDNVTGLEAVALTVVCVTVVSIAWIRWRRRA